MDLEETLEKWSSAKEKLSILEDKIEKYKKIVEREMAKTGKKVIETDKHSVTKRDVTRKYLSKDSVPSDVWEKYAVKTSFSSYILKRKAG